MKTELKNLSACKRCYYWLFTSGVRVNDNDSIEAAIKKFKREVTNAGTLTELKRREFYEKPSMLKKKARDAAIRKRERKRMLYGND